VYAHAAAGRVMRFAAAGFGVSLEQTQAPRPAGACVVMRGSEAPALARLGPKPVRGSFASPAPRRRNPGLSLHQFPASRP
jgi:hypothetical protein